jgi:two-component sensor histidine kinase
MNKLPLRLRLPLLIAGTMLPLILFAAGVVYLNHMRAREAAFGRVLETVKGIQLVLDTELQGITLALEVLANSRALQNDDFEGFRNNVAAFLRRYPSPSGISLADRDGGQIFNSNIPYGQPVPPRAYTRSIEEVFRTGQPAYSDLFIGSVSRQRIVVVSVPVMRAGNVGYELAFNPPLEMFQHIIQRQRPSDDWTMSIFDRTGTNIARIPNPDQTIGLKASPTLLPAILSQKEGKLPTLSLEGVELLTAFTRSPLTGWTVAAGIPVTSLTAPLWQELTITASVGLVLLAIGLVFAIGMAARIARGEMLHDLLINELNHRVKNTLATVQSIASQTFRSSANTGEARTKFDARLASLGRAHNILSDEKWESAEIREIVDSVLEPYMSKDGGRLRIAGPDGVRLPPNVALMLSMVLHELATNAAKYGALANGSGSIAIEWQTLEGKRLRLTWRERGGPPAQPAERKGFGSTLIEEAFAAQAGGSATLEYGPNGVVCVLECPHL